MVRGPDLDPDQVTRLLRLRPTKSWRKGEPNSLGTSSQSAGGWKRAIPQSLQAKRLDQQLSYWCRLMVDRKRELRALTQREELCALDCLVIAEKTASIIVPQDLQCAIAKLGIELRLSFWVSWPASSE